MIKNRPVDLEKIIIRTIGINNFDC